MLPGVLCSHTILSRIIYLHTKRGYSDMSTTKTSIKRHSLEEARAIIDRLGKYYFDDFHPLFKEGKVPLFEEIEGMTLGSFLVLGPNTGWWRKLGLMIFFDNSLARWTGKRFTTPFSFSHLSQLFPIMGGPLLLPPNNLP